MRQLMQRTLGTTYKQAAKSAAGPEAQLSQQQVNQIKANVGGRAAPHKDIVAAVSILEKAMQSTVKDGVAESKQHVNTVTRYTLAGCVGGVAFYEYMTSN